MHCVTSNNVDTNIAFLDMNGEIYHDYKNHHIQETNPNYESLLKLTISCTFQIHLHDQGEVPQMKDQGFAVAPGTHTLIGVKRYEVLFIIF